MTKLHPTEADVKKAVKKLLDQYGWFHWMPPANMYGANGQSDILAIRHGQFLAIETKLKKANGTANQMEFLQNITDNGGIGTVVNMDGLGDFERLLQRLGP